MKLRIPRKLKKRIKNRRSAVDIAKVEWFFHARIFTKPNSKSSRALTNKALLNRDNGVRYDHVFVDDAITYFNSIKLDAESTELFEKRKRLSADITSRFAETCKAKSVNMDEVYDSMLDALNKKQ